MQFSEDSAQRKGKSKALKVESESSSDEASDETTDDEVALMSRKFKQMLKKKGRSNRLFRKGRRSSRRSNKEDSKEIICYECKKPGHMKADCPKLKKRSFPNRRKKKNLLATWTDEDNTDESDAEVANICLMANNGQ